MRHQPNDHDPDLARALRSIADRLKWLGNGDAGTTLGDIDAHGIAIRDGEREISDSLLEVALAIREMSGSLPYRGPENGR